MPVRGHFQSRDKDGGHIIESAIVENPLLRKHRNRAIEPELLTIKVLNAGQGHSRLPISVLVESPYTTYY